MPLSQICWTSSTSTMFRGLRRLRRRLRSRRSRWGTIPVLQRPWGPKRAYAEHPSARRPDLKRETWASHLVAVAYSAFVRCNFLGNDFEGPHHVVVLMLQHVAVKDIAAGVAFKARDNRQHVSGVDDGGVLPPGFPGLRRAR